MVDNQNLDGAAGRFELESELFLDGGEDRWDGWGWGGSFLGLLAPPGVV